MRPVKAAFLTTGAVLGGVSVAAAYGAVSKSSQMFGPAVYRGPGRRRSVSLTFDDGPSEGTLALLDYLDGEGIKATFFLCGKNVERHPEIAGRIAASGHEIGNHTYSHPHLPLKSQEFIEAEFAITQRILVEETGITPMLMRPPYGLRWSGLESVQRKFCLLAVLWTVIGNDWKLDSNRIAHRVIRAASPGGIICLHDGRAVEEKPDITETLAAVRQIVPLLRDQGYDFETAGQILD